jgi:hypothetical protein
MEPDLRTISSEDVYVPSEKVVARNIEGEIIIVPIEDGVADFNDALYSLNETGRKMWELFSSKTSIGMICAQLAEEYNAPMETIQADVLKLIHKLADMKLIKKIGQLK